MILCMVNCNFRNHYRDILMQIMTKLSYQKKKKNTQTFNIFKLKIAFIPYISKNMFAYSLHNYQ